MAFTPLRAGGIISSDSRRANAGIYWQFSLLPSAGQSRPAGGRKGYRGRMNRKIRAGLVAFIAISLAALAVLVLFHYRIRGVGNVEVVIDDEGDVGVRIEEIHYSGTRDGRTEWELRADSATRTREGGVTTLEDVSFTYYVPEEDDEITLTAPAGTYDEQRGVIDATGGVTITSRSGYSLRSDTLRYSLTERKITTDAPVDISSRGLEVRGRGLLVEPDKGKMRIFSDIEAVVKGSAL